VDAVARACSERYSVVLYRPVAQACGERYSEGLQRRPVVSAVTTARSARRTRCGGRLWRATPLPARPAGALRW
jgi:hypothetical protein